ncbi:hypothetical protein PHYSODRAFT_335644 [Phytophthora sojae]|uniref:Uncharacterized protein n=1 Tax=Phytophthora sojae (strain P6497) TaxID=1094619 RepID=G4ZRF9_PHYSP|nr:hypothetical protein PHYSODRAFT_335644 [Phytophthora sojae]EGZ13951.1 hypothetical protein PHYSODRAFT_335644 [Phytophthora sojae]|eukprot:XP_009531380.1 hypothetical protein PHYSODRAFT_335644 [Phytophthora sojae]
MAHPATDTAPAPRSVSVCLASRVSASVWATAVLVSVPTCWASERTLVWACPVSAILRAILAPAYNNAPVTIVNGAPATTATTTGPNGASTANANANANANGGNNPYSTKTVSVTNGDGTSNTASVSNGNGAAATGGASASATASASASASARVTAGVGATSSQKTYCQLRSVE